MLRKHAVDVYREVEWRYNTPPPFISKGKVVPVLLLTEHHAM
jgi:hypothetical protein